MAVQPAGFTTIAQMGRVPTVSKQYQYTLYRQDGDIESWKQAKMDLTQIKEVLGNNCSMIEIIPKDYYPDGVKFGTVYGDEEGRFNSMNRRNPHFKVIIDTYGQPWDCVGNLLHEKAIK